MGGWLGADDLRLHPLVRWLAESTRAELNNSYLEVNTITINV
jgi:hypothetical protein